MKLTTPTTIPSERLKAARSSLQISGEKFASGLGVTKAAVSSWETGKNAITQPIALAIEYVFDISSEWILHGLGPVHARRIGEGNPGDQSRPLIEGNPGCGPAGDIQDPGPAARRYFVHLPPPAGIGIHGFNSVEELFYARAEGDSMDPTIQDGDLVLLDTNVERRLNPMQNGIYLVRRQPEDPEPRLRRALVSDLNRQLLFAPDNRFYQSLSIDSKELTLHQVILGRVLWVGHTCESVARIGGAW